MAACIAQQSSTQLPLIMNPRKFLRTTTYESRATPTSCRKRLLSEQNDCYISHMKLPDDESGINKRAKTGNYVTLMPMRGTNGRRDACCFRMLYSRSFSAFLSPTYSTLPYLRRSFSSQPIDLFSHESSHTQRRHGMQSTLSLFERTRHSHSAPGSFFHHKNISHSSFTYKNNVNSAQTSITFLPTLSTTTTSEKNMLVCSQPSEIVINNETDRDNNSILLTCSEAAAILNSANPKILVIDCGSPLRHTERRIQDSFLLNVNDRISRRRLSTRGLKNFLDNNQLNRFDESEFIVLYDDSIRPSSGSCANSSIQSQLSPPMKCIYDEIKRYDNNKTIYILQSSFDDFYQHHPSLCYISTSTDEDLSLPSPSPIQQMDIECCQLSEILPGLFLGSSRDAEDLNLLKQYQIKTIINISTSIPCYFENENYFEYLRLPCHDSPNQNILQYFETTFEYIHQKLSTYKNILVHCQGGVSRSPSFIIGYLMKYHSKTFDEAHNLVRNKRSIINPNLNFLGQLTRYQQTLNSA